VEDEIDRGFCTCGGVERCVTVRLSLKFIIGCWSYTLDREDSCLVARRVERFCVAVRRAEIVEKMVQEQRESKEGGDQ
jgi:hypothetical protein